MFEHMAIAAMVKARQHDMLQEAECNRIVRQARATGIGFRKRALARIGGLLISVGEMLQERYAPVIPQGSGAYQSHC